MRVDVVSRACVVGLVGTFGGSAFGGALLVSHAHVVDTAERETGFTLQFNEAPDVDVVAVCATKIPAPSRSLEELYRSHDRGPDVLGTDVVVLSGLDVSIDGDLDVRDTIGVDDDPIAGDLVPDGRDPFELLGERDESHRFTIKHHEAAEMTGAESVAAPLPPALWPAMVVLGGTLTFDLLQE